MKYSTFLYGSGVLYGFTPVIDYLYADEGPSSGGTAYYIMGENLRYTGDDDVFDAGVLSPILWTDLSAGSGVVTTNAPHLLLSTGTTTGSVAGIGSLHQYLNHQWQVRVSIPRLTVYPDSTVVLFSQQMYVDASNYCLVSVNQGTTSGTTTVSFSVIVGGVLVDDFSQDWTFGVSTFRLLRWKNEVYFFANGSLVFKSTRFITDPVSYRYFNDNLASSFDALCTVEAVNMKTFVAFDDQLDTEVVMVSDYRIRGFTPPSADIRGVPASYAGFVDVSVACQQTATRADFFEYYYENSLTLAKSNQFGLKLSIIDDVTVRTPNGIEKGLGGGR
jgi:hypothetical protein